MNAIAREIHAIYAYARDEPKLWIRLTITILAFVLFLAIVTAVHL